MGQGISQNHEHYVRQTTFRSKVKNQNYYSVAVNAGYYITPEAKETFRGRMSYK
ncbi:omptin family outer membrane protease [Escherichia coli]